MRASIKECFHIVFPRKAFTKILDWCALGRFQQRCGFSVYCEALFVSAVLVFGVCGAFAHAADILHRTVEHIYVFYAQ